MLRNVSGQKIFVFAFDGTTGAGKTGDAGNITVYVNKDGAGSNALNDTSAAEVDPTKAPGWYVFDLLQAETDANTLLFTGKSVTSNVNVVGKDIQTVPPNFTLLNIDGSGFIGLQTAQRPGYRKNVSVSFLVFMSDSTTLTPATGKLVSVTRSIDTGTFGAGTIGTVTELSNGYYFFTMAAADMNGDVILIRATAAGCNDVGIEIRTSP